VSCHHSTGLNCFAALGCGSTGSIGVLGLFLFGRVCGGCLGKVFLGCRLYDMVVRGGFREDGGWANWLALEFWG